MAITNPPVKETTIVSETTSPETKDKKARLASIIHALQIKGETLTDEDMQAIQLKTDALRVADDAVHVDIGGSGGVHIHQD